MELKNQKKLKKVSNVQKNFIYECQICFEDYDQFKHVPMIVCSNYHAICAQCVKSNLFKKEYNAQKDPTGRYMCSKCSQIIQKEDIREHTILKKVFTYIDTIRQKDEELRKDIYNRIGTMGMDLVAMKEDYDAIEKNNLILQKENQQFIKESRKLKDEFLKIQKIKMSLKELDKLTEQVEDIKEILELESVKLQSLRDQIKRNQALIKEKKEEILAYKQQFFALKGELTSLRHDLKLLSKQKKQLKDQNQFSINFKKNLLQEINNLWNQKKMIQEQNKQKKIRADQSLKLLQIDRNKILKNGKNLQQLILNPFEKGLKMQKELLKFETQTKLNLNKQKCIFIPSKKQQAQQKVQEAKPQQINFFDHWERSISNFLINHSTVTLTNEKLSSYTHISFQQGFNISKDSFFTIKIHKLRTQQIMIGLMTEDCKKKKNIHERKGFYAIDGLQKAWNDGNCDKSSICVRQGDIVTVKFIKDDHCITFSRRGKNDSFVIKLPQIIRDNLLYPVVLLITEGDSFEVVEVMW